MHDLYRYTFDDLDLDTKVILDAAIGAAESTLEWAKQIEATGGTSRIIGVDIDPDHKMVKENLGEWLKYVALRTADIFHLDTIDDNSIDIVNCNDTVVFLSAQPPGLVAAFREFHRVLKQGGTLIITSENPVTDLDNPDNVGQWHRWNFAKAVCALQGKVWSLEPAREEVENLLRSVDFTVTGAQSFPGAKTLHCSGTINEWREIMIREIDSAPWSRQLTQALLREVDDIHLKVSTDQFLMCPELFVVKSLKK
ncbi:MAG: class I SAM-dependent methyltransferase [bacterium]|nr:class I SAM-dependent methyltransferase [bacterium]